MTFSVSNDQKIYSVVYSESVLTMNGTEQLFFNIINEKEKFQFEIAFLFSDDGEPLSTTFWETPEKNTLFYKLHKWVSPTWIEIAKPVLLKGQDLDGDYYLKFRSVCNNPNYHREFSITIWKHVVKLDSNG